jgi:hypothetical protein
VPCLLWLSISIGGCAADKQQEEPVPINPFATDDGSWRYVTAFKEENPSKTVYVYSFQRAMVKVAPGGAVSMWFKFIPVEDFEGPPRPEHLSYHLTREEVDCDKGVMRNLVIRDYDWRDKVITETVKSGEWSPIAPETVGYSMYSTACASPQKVAHETWGFLKSLGKFLDRVTEDKNKR